MTVSEYIRGLNDDELGAFLDELVIGAGKMGAATVAAPNGAAFLRSDICDVLDEPPVRHGEWMRLQTAPMWQCTLCGHMTLFDRKECPNCSAIMY